jgi:hypothetical protein
LPFLGSYKGFPGEKRVVLGKMRFARVAAISAKLRV